MTLLQLLNIFSTYSLHISYFAERFCIHKEERGSVNNTAERSFNCSLDVQSLPASLFITAVSKLIRLMKWHIRESLALLKLRSSRQ